MSFFLSFSWRVQRGLARESVAFDRLSWRGLAGWGFLSGVGFFQKYEHTHVRPNLILYSQSSAHRRYQPDNLIKVILTFGHHIDSLTTISMGCTPRSRHYSQRKKEKNLTLRRHRRGVSSIIHPALINSARDAPRRVLTADRNSRPEFESRQELRRVLWDRLQFVLDICYGVGHLMRNEVAQAHRERVASRRRSINDHYKLRPPAKFWTFGRGWGHWDTGAGEVFSGNNRKRNRDSTEEIQQALPKCPVLVHFWILCGDLVASSQGEACMLQFFSPAIFPSSIPSWPISISLAKYPFDRNRQFIPFASWYHPSSMRVIKNQAWQHNQNKEAGVRIDGCNILPY